MYNTIDRDYQKYGSACVSSKFQVLFVNEAPYWQGNSVQFSGMNAAFLTGQKLKNKQL